MKWGENISNKNYAIIITIVLLLIIFTGSVSATDLNSTNDDLNLNTFSIDNGETYFSEEVNETLILEDTVQDNMKETFLSGNDTQLYYMDGTSFKVVLSDSEGLLLPNQNIIFTINNINYTRTTDSNGVASITINLQSGIYNISSYYAGSESYNPSSATNTLKILSTIYGEDIEKYYRNDTQYYATFISSQGLPLKDTTVTFNINGVFYERKTDEKGIAKLNINLNTGVYILTAINPVNGEMHSNNITVINTIIASDIVKYYKNNTKYSARILNGQGNPLVNQEVALNINGIIYTRTSDENGYVGLNINLNPGNYTITITNPINSEMHSNNIEVLPTISSDDLTMSYRDGSRYKANVLDDTGNPLAGSEVKFNINGVFYTRTTDSEGNAYLNINLNIGQYIITSTNHKGLSVSNKINIYKSSSTIEAYDAHIITGIDRDYTVTLYGLNNITVPSNNVEFKYNGISQTAVTDENGQATIVISNLKKGNYTLEYEFEGNMNYYSYKSSSTLIVENPTNILTGKDLEMIYKDGSMFNVTLKDLESKVMANKSIIFEIAGILYNRTTDENGVASLNINLNPGTYEISYSYMNVNDTDYNKGTNTIVILKIPIYISANDLAFNYGEKGVFTANLSDSNGNPIEGIDVIFQISGSSYTRTTNASGTAKLNINLPVGYYDVETSLENTFYTAESKYSHILVDGTLLIADDLSLIPGLTRDFSVTLLDAYKNPIPNAVIEFSYNGITKYATTNENGIATIQVNIDIKGDYVIVYKYAARNNSGQAYILVSDSVLNTKNTITNLSPYLSSSNNCPVSNAEIVALANQLTEGLTQPLDKAIAIFNYVRDAISYSYYYNTYYGAVGTLHAKKGNCVDQSHLSIALYRAAGLPARYVHGSCTFTDGDSGGHVWSQVLIEDTWIVSDTINVRNSLGNVVNWNNYNYVLKGYYSSLSF